MLEHRQEFPSKLTRLLSRLLLFQHPLESRPPPLPRCLMQAAPERAGICTGCAADLGGGGTGPSPSACYACAAGGG